MAGPAAGHQKILRALPELATRPPLAHRKETMVQLVLVGVKQLLLAVAVVEAVLQDRQRHLDKGGMAEQELIHQLQEQTLLMQVGVGARVEIKTILLDMVELGAVEILEMQVQKMAIMEATIWVVAAAAEFMCLVMETAVTAAPV